MAKRILVTGGAGRLGTAVCDELAEYELVILDIKPPVRDHEFIHADLADAEKVSTAIQGCDAVAHMGAIPGETKDTRAIFQSNVVGTYNVLEGMASAGVGRIVFASSIRAYGAADMAPNRYVPKYIPVDEEHPLLPSTLYGFTKQAGEQMCERYHRSHGISGAAMRFPQIVCDARYDRLNDLYSHRILWSYIDVRDAALAVRLALERDSQDFDIFNITADDSFADAPMLDQIRESYPEVTDIRDTDRFRTGRPTLYSIDRAKALLGYKPEHSFTTYLPGE